jgi:hypothetical protein
LKLFREEFAEYRSLVKGDRFNRAAFAVPNITNIAVKVSPIEHAGIGFGEIGVLALGNGSFGDKQWAR